jgi:hypothetical protein
MTRHGPVTTQDETTQHGCQVAPTPAAPVGCAIPPPTTHPGSIMQLRERLSPVVCAAPGSISAMNQVPAVSKVRADEHTGVPRQGRLLVAAAVAGGQG